MRVPRRFSSPLVGAGVAIILLGLVVVPWPPPRPEVLIQRFDPDLITIDPRGNLPRAGQIRVSDHELTLTALSRSQPTVHLLTSEVPFVVAFTIAVLRPSSEGTFPFQMKVWNPRAEVAVEIWYAPDGSIVAGTRQQDTWIRMARLGEYRVRTPHRWHIRRDEERVTFEVEGAPGGAVFAVSRQTLPALFQQESLSLTVFASATSTRSAVAAVRDPFISVPYQSRYGTSVQSLWFRPVAGLAAVLGLLWVSGQPRRRIRLVVEPRDVAIVCLISAAGVLAGWWLSRFPGLPLDVRAALVWSHTAREYGLAAVVGSSLLATEGTAHGGLPYAPVTYPYPPLLTYVFWIAGRMSAPDRIDQTLKMLAMLAVIAGGSLLYLLLRHLRIRSKLSALVMMAYVLNPAVLFDSAVWGQTDAFVGLFLLSGAAGAILDSAPLLWSGVLLASLTKQTGALIALILIAAGVARLGAGRMLQGLPAGIVVAFLALTPALLAGVHPAAVYRPVVTKVAALGTIRYMEPFNAVVSQGTFTLWSTTTALEGARGIERLAFPDFVPSRLGISYFVLSRLAFGGAVLALVLLSFRRSHPRPGMVLLSAAAYAVAAPLLLTRVLPRYFYFGILFAAATLPWMPRFLGAAVIVALSATTLVSMWGMFAQTSHWYPGVLPAFSPERSWLNGIASSLLGSDTGITVGGLLNLGVFLALLVGIWLARGEPRSRMDRPSA